MGLVETFSSAMGNRPACEPIVLTFASEVDCGIG
jgi:hypothetical protein